MAGVNVYLNVKGLKVSRRSSKRSDGQEVRSSSGLLEELHLEIAFPDIMHRSRRSRFRDKYATQDNFPITYKDKETACDHAKLREHGGYREDLRCAREEVSKTLLQRTKRARTRPE